MTVPNRAQVERLMKRCQIGVGGRNALDDAHSIMADAYGTLGALMLEVERLNAWEASAAQWQTEVKNLRAALIAVMPFVDDAADVQNLFPNSAASKECRAAVAAVRAVLGVDE